MRAKLIQSADGSAISAEITTVKMEYPTAADRCAVETLLKLKGSISYQI